jgi:hypothetical protein
VSENEGAKPVLRVVSGSPTPEDLAVITAVVTAAASGGGAADEPQGVPRGRWADPFDQHRRPWQSGPGGWRAAIR